MTLTPTDDVAVRYRAGDLMLDSGAARVLRGDLEIPLAKLSFDVLRVLIEAAPNLVSLDALMARAWPGLVVSPETVVQRIKLLRDALGDDAKEPRYIAGVRGRGYRVVAPVQRLPDRDEPAAAPASVVAAAGTESAPAPKRSAWSRAPTIALVLVLGALAAVVAGQRWLTPAPKQAAHATAAPSRSVAVLPFVSLSKTPNDGVLALGIAEAVLHQLAAAPDLTVIARTSSFEFNDRNVDAREVGRALNVRYLLEGSVQSDGAQLRVTAQLVDAENGANVWSVRFERSPHDIFKLQDDIALAVARTLKLSLEGRAAERITGQGTANFDAYFSFLQGRAEMASLRLGDVTAAASQFSHSIELDPEFAPAYVDLADARLMLAEFEVSGDRRARFASAVEEGTRLVERALALGGANGHAYVMRGYLRAFSDLAAAEADYRRGLELSPNYAKGYEGLASVLFENPMRRDEALTLLDRARALDPLEPKYDVLKAVFLHYGRGATAEADAILVDVLARHPLYQPALMRLATIRGIDEGRFADGVKFGEQALALDPRSEWTRRVLIRAYLNIGDLVAARRIAAEPQPALQVRQLAINAFLQDWRRAGEIAYASADDSTQMPIDAPFATFAIRLHARATGEYNRARALLERQSGVTWDAAGAPHLPVELGLADQTVALGDVLMQTGERERARRLLEASLRDMDYVAHDLKRGDLWYVNQRPIAFALLGDKEAALTALERAVASGVGYAAGYATSIDPAFDALRDTPRFKALAAKLAAHAKDGYAAVEQLRREHLVPAAALSR
jgi:TolB-like protein/DNA-binding winged helix-turn-helix (wHTH) protein